MRNRIVNLFLVAVFICSCDPMDDRMVFYNNTEEDVFVRMIFFPNKRDVKWPDALHSKRVNANDKYRVETIFSWEGSFENSSDSLLNVVVLGNYKFLSENRGFKEDVKSDSLLAIGDYQVKQYTYDELKRLEWKINYPDDGFERGKPVEVTPQIR